MNNNPLELLNLGSISGIVVATMFIIEILKRIFDKTTWFAKVPVFVYAGGIAVILALIANHITTDNGSKLLEGNTWKVLWAALISALGSSGFYSWLNYPLTSGAKLGDKNV